MLENFQKASDGFGMGLSHHLVTIWYSSTHGDARSGCEAHVAKAMGPLKTLSFQNNFFSPLEWVGGHQLVSMRVL